MSNKSDLLKTIVKGTMTTEDASLDKYLLSRGINPKFATKDQKVAHSKTGQFINNISKMGARDAKSALSSYAADLKVAGFDASSIDSIIIIFYFRGI